MCWRTREDDGLPRTYLFGPNRCGQERRARYALAVETVADGVVVWRQRGTTEGVFDLAAEALACLGSHVGSFRRDNCCGMAIKVSHMARA